MNDATKRPPLSHASGTPVPDNFNIQTAGPSLALFQNQSAGDVQ